MYSNRPATDARDRLVTLVVVLVVCTFLPEQSTAETRVSTRDRTTVGLEDGEVQWRLRHPSQWKLADYRLVEPVRFEGRTFYGVGPDLVEVDPELGQIDNRWRFPARIDELAAGDDALEVTVAVPPPENDNSEPLASDRTTTLSYRPGDPVPGRGFWSIDNFEQMTSAFEAQALGSASPNKDLSDGDLFRRLGRRWRRDRTNPFIPLRRAELAQQMGNDAFADSLFETAADTEGIHWFDDLLLWANLEKHGRTELADTVYERARRRMERRGVRPSRLAHQLLAVTLHGRFKNVIKRAARNGDKEKLDQLLGRLADVLPRFETAAQTWSYLADWFASRGAAATADRWRQRAKEARASAAWHRTHKWGSAAGLYLTLLYGTALGLVLGGFVLGLRSASSGREPDDASSGWLSSPTWLGIAGLCLCAGLSFPTSTMFQRANFKVHTSMLAPDGVITDGYASPAVVDWLEGQPDSAPRNAFLDYARSELEAAQQGIRPESSGPPQTRLVEVLEASARQRFGWLSRPELQSEPPDLFGIAGQLGRLSSGMLGALGTAALAFLIGSLFAYYLPRAGRWLRRCTPGAAVPHRLLVAPCIGAFSTAMLALAFGFDTAYVDLMRFGTSPLLDSLKPDATEQLAVAHPPRYWAWTLLAGVLIFHAYGLWSEHRDGE